MAGRSAWAVGVLLLALLLATPARSGPVTSLEAGLLAHTADVVDPARAAGLRATAEAALTNLLATVERSLDAGELVLYPMLVEGWTFVNGESLPVIRWLAVLGAALTFAVAFRLLRHLPFRLALALAGLLALAGSATGSGLAWGMLVIALITWAVVALLKLPRRYAPLSVGLILLALAALAVYLALLVPLQTPDWPARARDLHAARPLTEPLVIALPPAHPLRYYDRQPGTQFSGGLAVDVGWRDFSDEELAAVAAALDSAPQVHLLAEADSGLLARLRDLFGADHLRFFVP